MKLCSLSYMARTTSMRTQCDLYSVNGNKYLKTELSVYVNDNNNKVNTGAVKAATKVWFNSRI